MAREDELFKQLLGFDPFQLTRNVPVYPPTDVYYEGNKFTIEMACAGFTKDELDVVTKDGELILSGMKATEKKKNFIQNGISARKFERKWVLEPSMKVIDAEFVDGILRVVVEKREDPKSTKRLTIK